MLFLIWLVLCLVALSLILFLPALRIRELYRRYSGSRLVTCPENQQHLLGDLRRPEKGEAYRQMARECWYVLAEGIGDADDVPGDYGVMVERASVLDVLRPAPRRALRLPFATWMALARATPEVPPESTQASLGDPGDGPAQE